MAPKAGSYIRYYYNPRGAAVSVVRWHVIEKDGFYFNDIGGAGKVTAVNGCRLSANL